MTQCFCRFLALFLEQSLSHRMDVLQAKPHVAFLIFYGMKNKPKTKKNTGEQEQSCLVTSKLLPHGIRRKYNTNWLQTDMLASLGQEHERILLSVQVFLCRHRVPTGLPGERWRPYQSANRQPVF